MLMKYKKIMSVILSFVILLGVSFSVPTSVSATSYKENIINAIIDNEDVWSKNWFGSGYYGCGTIKFIDLNFDGNLEFVVTHPCGSLRNVSNMVYYYENGTLCYANGGEENYIIQGYAGAYGYSGLNLKGYYVNEEQGIILLGTSMLYSTMADGFTGNYILEFKNNELLIDYYSAEYSDSERFTLAPPKITYYDNAEVIGRVGSANIITENEYKMINDSMIENCIDINMSYSSIKSTDWEYYSESTKRRILEQAYDSFTYDKYLYGDANGDGSINIVDATYVQMFIAKYKLDDFNEKLADYDRSGEVNILDSTAIQMKVAKLA